MTNRWSSSEDWILTHMYHNVDVTGTRVVFEFLPNRTPRSVTVRASILGISNPTPRWTQPEILPLAKYRGLPIAKVHTLIPTRTTQAIQLKAWYEGLGRGKGRNKLTRRSIATNFSWTRAQKQFIRENMHLSFRDLSSVVHAPVSRVRSLWIYYFSAKHEGVLE